MDKTRRYFSVALDLLIMLVAVFSAYSLRWELVPLPLTWASASFAILVVIGQLSCFYFLGIYHRIWEYASVKDFLNILVAVTMGSVLMMLITVAFFPELILPAIPLFWLISILLFGGVRCLRRIIQHYTNTPRQDKNSKRTLVIGAGGAGVLIVRTLLASKFKVGLEPIGFIDDDNRKQGLQLYGLPVLGTREDIPEVIRKLAVDEAIIAIPSATPGQIKSIALICRQTGVKVKVLPSVLDLIQGKTLLNQVRELQMEDLLHRSEVEVNLEQVSGYIKGQVVLVTGAGGSIGSELCRQICAFQPKQLILLGRGENSIYEINLELTQAWPEMSILPVIADIKDYEKIQFLFAKYRPDVIFHAAAHKHVNLMELHPDEAFKNNVFGTLNLARAADSYRVKTFVLISTDKAVNPASVMGLTKLLAEIIIRGYAEDSNTKFAVVRFGNVLGSRGSVVRLFRSQIASGGPVTVTHPDMRRYFMTIREAVQLVIQAGAMTKGGELFMLDMGEQVKIVDLARDMIRLSGLIPGKDIEIKYLGVRSGEKLFEELHTANEKAVATQHQKIFAISTESIDIELLGLIKSVVGTPGKEDIKALTTLAIKKLGQNMPRAGC